MAVPVAMKNLHVPSAKNEKKITALLTYASGTSSMGTSGFRVPQTPTWPWPLPELWMETLDKWCQERQGSACSIWRQEGVMATGWTTLRLQSWRTKWVQGSCQQLSFYLTEQMQSLSQNQVNDFCYVESYLHTDSSVHITYRARHSIHCPHVDSHENAQRLGQCVSSEKNPSARKVSIWDITGLSFWLVFILLGIMPCAGEHSTILYRTTLSTWTPC